jgi:hypothetical protein
MAAEGTGSGSTVCTPFTVQVDSPVAFRDSWGVELSNLTAVADGAAAVSQSAIFSPVFAFSDIFSVSFTPLTVTNAEIIINSPGLKADRLLFLVVEHS